VGSESQYSRQERFRKIWLDKFYVRVTVHRNKFLYNKTN
jgi:hypothetical protein